MINDCFYSAMCYSSIAFCLKPGFHMIATIVVIAAIAGKKKFSDRRDHSDHKIVRLVREEGVIEHDFSIFDRVAMKTENSLIHEPRKRQIPKLSRANCVIIQLTVGT